MTSDNKIFQKSPINLFQTVNFRSHSGQELTWKIEADALSAQEWYTIKCMILDLSAPFREAIGIPRGGTQLGQLLNQHGTGNKSDPILIVDDVLTTGGSMLEYQRQRAFRNPTEYIGWVVFARNKPPKWCRALFQMPF